MKNIILKIAVSTGTFLPFLASAQVAVGPYDNTTTQGANQFHNLIIAMESDSGDLYTPEGESLSVQSEIYFNTVQAVSFPNHYGTADWDTTSTSVAAPVNPLLNLVSYKFTQVANFPAFMLAQGGVIDVGFVGNESRHQNEFGFDAGAGFVNLFNYNQGVDLEKPPSSVQLTAGAATQIVFQHNNLTLGDSADQSHANRFKMFQYDNGNPDTSQGTYLFAIADRDGNVDNDYDDGFFFLTGDITPVPEPSQIAALSLIGLGALLLVRRRIRNRKA